MGIYWDGTSVGFAFLGGFLISISTIINLFAMGRITGLSGILFTISTWNKKEGLIWKISFMIGLIGIIMMFRLGTDKEVSGQKVFDGEDAGDDLDAAGWILGGLFIGVGTKWGNGCTSGHAVCGVPRLAPRSIIATCIFLSFGLATATLRHYKPFLNDTLDVSTGTYDTYRLVSGWIYLAAFIGFLVLAAITALSAATTKIKKLDLWISCLTGAIFGLGLLLSGMCRRTKILAFLTLADGWDPSLIFVMASAVGVNLFAFNWILKQQKPICSEKFNVTTNREIDYGIIIGPALFGIGWGLTGFCPGPAMANLVLLPQAALELLFIIIGQVFIDFVLKKWKARKEKLLSKDDVDLGSTSKPQA
ncbi:unnamed protein product [Blepharisma stoltei]|uniref:Sulphur transport domain-containing protein n=1 Tax=Blepharisma stoltei TaxID=1481888 RepID=A0AAU9K4J6_9CILI|nr:unnamed protein product [Blepharisma stoltei]